MPHAIYLHSSLTQNRIVPQNEDERRRLIRLSNREVLCALGFAGLVNMAMVCMAASVFHPGHADVATIETAYATLMPLLGKGAAGVFLVALIASGLSSSAVGTLAGQVVMQGFVGFGIPVWLRRLITMAPAFVVVGLGIDATTALVLSQVVLSLILPLPMVTLLMLTGRRDVMGGYANSRLTARIAGAAAALVLALNLLLVCQVIGLRLW
jgi:manganese transport protein